MSQRVTRLRDGTIQQKAVLVEDEESSSPEREDAPAAPRRAKPSAAAAPIVADDTRTGPGLVTKTPQGELNALYQAVVTDVVVSVKTEFQAAGADDAALQMLERLWRQKLEESGVMEPPEGTASHLMRQGLLQATVQGSMQLMTQGGAGASKGKAGASGSNKRQKAADGSIVATGEAGEAEDGVLETVPEDEERIRQLEKEELSSDSEDGDKEPETAHLVLAQFDKVARTKSKWKCSLKDGILHLNGRDYCCSKGQGDFEF